MTTIFLCNVGTRDVAYDGKIFPKEARQRGKAWWEEYEEAKGSLSFPIIAPALKYVLDRVGTLDQLVFFGTNQTHEHYRKSDTLYFARLVDQWVADVYGAQVSAHEVVLVTGINPSLYDQAFDKYGTLLAPYADETVERCYLLASGGIPACNTALLLRGIAYFRNRCQVIYQTENNLPQPLKLGRQVTQMMQRETAVQHLNRFDFAAALDLLHVETATDRLVAHLLGYASARLWFEFEAAQRHLDEAITETTDGDSHDQLVAMQDGLQQLVDGDEKALLGELFHNARIAWNNGRYIDFLGRLYRFYNGALRLLVAQLPPDTFDSPVQPDSLATETAYRNLILAQIAAAAQKQGTAAGTLSGVKREQLRQMMEQSFNLSELRQLCFDLGITYENLAGETRAEQVISLIEYTLRHGTLSRLLALCHRERPHLSWKDVATGAERQSLLLTASALQRMEKLGALYRQSIIAEGYGGVSKERIVATAYGAKNEQAHVPSPTGDMATVCAMLEIPVENPYRNIKRLVISTWPTS